MKETFRLHFFLTCCDNADSFPSWMQYDFPETFDLLESISKAAGFKNVTILHAASKGISQCLALES